MPSLLQTIPSYEAACMGPYFLLRNILTFLHGFQDPAPTSPDDLIKLGISTDVLPNFVLLLLALSGTSSSLVLTY